MDWSQVRISFLIATLPGLIYALTTMLDDPVEHKITLVFLGLWLGVLMTYIIPTLRGAQ